MSDIEKVKKLREATGVSNVKHLFEIFLRINKIILWIDRSA